ncbi:MAG: hypothetical protein P8O16_10515 [Algoriphagus sp.]|uniref:hypothetical protein n=1 Tax=Algoriphagus sp. TaxID=1872435 RepID=UPI002605DF29|nr:hypothetical protein [Algoriphagus sp.]MDG1277705.1 hypothetical protein [Algoriphagus sp.]
MKPLSLVFLICLFFVEFSFAKETQDEFVIKNANYSFELIPLPQTGFHKGGSASGPKMIQVIGKPDQVFKQVWPEFSIKSEWEKSEYSLKLTSSDQEINSAFLKEVLDDLINRYPDRFSIGTKSIEFNCMKVEDDSLLKNALFNPNRGIEKFIAHKNNSVEVKGLKLEEIAEWLTENTQYSFGFLGDQEGVYEVKINLTSAKTLACSLEKIGLNTAVCKCQVEEIILMD